MNRKTEQFTYNGNITTHTVNRFGLDRTTTTKLNGQGLVMMVTEPGNVISWYSYDAVGDLLKTKGIASK